jgi:hypothetical protein
MHDGDEGKRFLIHCVRSQATVHINAIDNIFVGYSYPEVASQKRGISWVTTH